MNDLIAWAEHYVKHRDLFKREITHISSTVQELHVTKKNGEERWIVLPLDDALADLDEHNIKTWVLLPDTKESISQTLRLWKNMVSHPELWLMFVDLKSNRNWALHPYTHAKISEERTLQQGLLALHDNQT